MAWTYDPTLPTDRNKVRLVIGDTDIDDQQLSNEEIDAMLAVYGSVRTTAIAAVRSLAAKYTRLTDKWVGDLKILASQRARAYLELADRLESSVGVFGAAGFGVPSAGGISIAQKETYELDTDRVVPAIRIGLHDNLESESGGD